MRLARLIHPLADCEYACVLRARCAVCDRIVGGARHSSLVVSGGAPPMGGCLCALVPEIRVKAVGGRPPDPSSAWALRCWALCGCGPCYYGYARYLAALWASGNYRSCGWVHAKRSPSRCFRACVVPRTVCRYWSVGKSCVPLLSDVRLASPSSLCLFRWRSGYCHPLLLFKASILRRTSSVPNFGGRLVSHTFVFALAPMWTRCAGNCCGTLSLFVTTLPSHGARIQ